MWYRSYMFVPGDDAPKLAKAAGAGADALIFDLEDAVAPECKERARRVVGEFLAGPIGSARFVRVNAIDSNEIERDIAATAHLKPDGYVLPKCEGPDQIETVARLLDKHGAPPRTGIMAIATETVRAVRRLMREDWSHPRLTAITWGGEDLSANLGASDNRGEDRSYLGPFQLARDLALFAACEAHAAPVDAVFTAFRDNDGLKREAMNACAMGFTGKLAIHPAQVAIINQAFTPTNAQVDWARKVLAALEASHSGVAQLDGEMLDAPHRRRAARILALVPQASG